MKLTIDTTDIDTIFIGSVDVHYRLVMDRLDGSAVSVCVQDFDYDDYGDRFIGEICFMNEVDADKAANKINAIGVKHFV